MLTYRYTLVDVFSEQRYRGNPLAVFTAARGLRTEQMARMAQELNLSESVFVLPDAEGAHARLRIFTPKCELPFAGHPVLGAAFVLGAPLVIPVLRLRLEAGMVEVMLEREGDLLSRGMMKQPLPTRLQAELTPELRDALGLSAEAASTVSAWEQGPRHLLVELASEAQLQALRAPGSTPGWPGGIAYYVSLSPTEYKLRYFAPSLGVGEDPATGSAVGALAAHLVLSGQAPAQTLLLFRQGEELGRDARILAEVQLEDPQTLRQVLVGGQAVVVGRGELMPPAHQEMR